MIKNQLNFVFQKTKRYFKNKNLFTEKEIRQMAIQMFNKNYKN